VRSGSSEDDEGEEWPETFGSWELLQAFLTGLKVGAQMAGDAGFAVPTFSHMQEQWVRNGIAGGKPYQLWPERKLGEVGDEDRE